MIKGNELILLELMWIIVIKFLWLEIRFIFFYFSYLLIELNFLNG